MDQLALMYRLMVLMMGHYPRQRRPVDVTFIFGRAQGDYEPTEGDSGLLEMAAELYHQHLTRLVAISGNKGNLAFNGMPVSTTYPGPESLRSRLQELGVLRNCIFFTPESPLHTQGESDAFVKLASDLGWSTALIIMQPHQGLRAMLSILKSMEKYGAEMQVTPVCPQRVNWSKPVYGSQGKLLLPRHEHIQQEWQRILKYQATGELATFAELDTYLTSCRQ